MQIAEIYKSVQGEGLLTGAESIFVRTSGCNLRCCFCDTRFTSWDPDGEDMGVVEILVRVADWSCRHVVLTGGEPMLSSELIPLCRALRRDGRHITIETAGTLYLPVECDLMSISPKLSNSTPTVEEAGPWRERHNAARQGLDVVRQLIEEHEFQLKFVVEQLEDCQEILDYLAKLPTIDRRRVLLMPEGIEHEKLQRCGEWLEPYCTAQGFAFCPRKHIEWFGATRGT